LHIAGWITKTFHVSCQTPVVSLGKIALAFRSLSALYVFVTQMTSLKTSLKILDEEGKLLKSI